MSNQKTSAGLNYIYSICYSILNMILPLMTSPYISRVLGAENLGIYSYSHAIANYFMLFAMLGINNFGSSRIAKVREDQEQTNQTFSNVFSMQLITASLMSVFYVIYILLFVREHFQIFLIQGVFVIGALFSVNWFFWGKEQFKITVTRNFIIKLLTFASIFIFVKTPDDLWVYALILSLGTTLSEGILFFILRKHVRFVRPDFKVIKTMIKPNIVLFIPILAVSIYRTMDKIMIKQLSDYAQVGYYTNSEKIIGLGLTFVTALGQVMMPKMAHILSKGDKTLFQRLFEKSVKFSTALGCAISFGILAVASTFVPFFFGPGYESCISILAVLAPNVILLAWGNVLKMQLLIPLERESVYIKAVGLGAVVNLALNILLIPHMGAVGASLGTLGAELVSVLVILICMRHEIKALRFLLNVLPYSIIGFVMFAAVRVVMLFLRSSPAVLSLIVGVLVGVLLYTFMLFLYWKYKKEPLLTEFIQIIKKKVKK